MVASDQRTPGAYENMQPAFLFARIALLHDA